MSRSLLIAVLAATFLVANPGAADAQGRLDPRRAARSLIDASVGYALVGGDLGDSLKAGPMIEASYQYQLENVPLRLGAGIGYSRHGLQDPAGGEPVSGSANKVSLMALGTLLLFSDETEMIPYVQARVGYTRMFWNSNGVDSKRSGLELGALVGVDLPISENVSIDVSGLFAWVNGGNATVGGFTLPDTSLSGSLFSLRAGAFFFF